MNLLLLLLITSLMHAARSFYVQDKTGSSEIALSFGYLLLCAFFAGRVFHTLKLPKLTGYIALGLIASPNVLGLISASSLEGLKLVNGIAVAMVALSAGTELELQSMRPLLRAIRWMTLLAVGSACVALAATLWLIRDHLPFMDGMTPLQSVALLTLLGIVMSAQSPAVVVALRDETNARGPLVSTVLGMVVIADMLIITLFAIASAFAKATFGDSADVYATLSKLTWELLGSLASGVILGFLLDVYVRKVRGSISLFLVVVAILVAEISHRVGLDPLLVSLSAGVFLRNGTQSGVAVHEKIEYAGLPIYVLFFSVTGATLHLDVLQAVGLWVLLLIVVRGVALYAGCRLGARIAGAPALVRSYAGLGLLPQAGLALALASLFARTFPEFGEQAGALVLGVVTANEILAPALYRWGIVRSGEASSGEANGDEQPLDANAESTSGLATPA